MSSQGWQLLNSSTGQKLYVGKIVIQQQSFILVFEGEHENLPSVFSESWNLLFFAERGMSVMQLDGEGKPAKQIKP